MTTLIDILIPVIMVATGVAALVVALAWLPTRLVRGLNAPKRVPDGDEDDHTWI